MDLPYPGKFEVPQAHRQYASAWSYRMAPPGRPGGLPRRGEPYFKTVTAYTLNEGKLVKNTIFEKPDQEFAKYATAFEKEWSKLVSPERPLYPVVDENLNVVGHVGQVTSSYIIVRKRDKSWLPEGRYLELPKLLLEAGDPVFVARNPPDAAWDRLLDRRGHEFSTFGVMTGIDGRVLAAGKGQTLEAGLVAEDITPIDIICFAKGLVQLGVGVGKAIVRGMVFRRALGQGAIVAFAGATKDLLVETGGRVKSFVTGITTYLRESGMTPTHFGAFKQAARESGVVAIVRNTNPASLPLIEKGCPGKPMFFKFHTSKSTGVVMAENPTDIALAWRHEYWVVGTDGIAYRNVMRGGSRVMEKMELKDAFWKVEKGQVIDPLSKKPLVGDYDLMGVFKPSNPGQNIALAASGGAEVKNRMSPIVERFTDKVNGLMKEKRVLHGAQDQFGGYRGGATVVHPNGTVTFLKDEREVEAFYKSWRRQPMSGSYNPPAPPPEPGTAPLPRLIKG